MKWYQDQEGNTSSMRIMAMLSTITGCFAVAAGAVAMFLGYPESVAIAGIGGGMAGLGELAKAMQAREGL
jgi:hypothetical protein